MKTRALTVSLALLLAASGLCHAAGPGPWNGNLNLRMGVKVLDDGDWDPVDNQGEVALQLDFRKPHWPVSAALDVSYSRDEENKDVFVAGFGPENAEFEGKTLEWNLGVRKIWEDWSYVRPYAGGGLALIWAKQKADATIAVEEEDDTGFGVWLGGGAFVTVWDQVNLGVDLRYSYAKVELFEDTNGGGFHAGVFVGYHWQ